MAYHIISSTAAFVPNMIVDITPRLDSKIRALLCHKSQSHLPFMDPEWVQLWHVHKEATAVGYKYVELFRLTKFFACA